MRRIAITFLKWPDLPHYEYTAAVIGEDEHGVWGACETGDEVLKAGEVAFVRPMSLLTLIPRQDTWWSALWYPPSEDKFEVYVNVNTPPTWNGDTVQMVDLDLDVERQRNGRITLLDEDELVSNSSTYGYPDDLIAAARRVAADVMTQLDEGKEPFASQWRVWHERCFSNAPGT